MTDKEEWELQCYGCLEADLKTEVENSLPVKMGLVGHGMVAMSILSDAQEEIERGGSNKARQYVNCAKWIIGNYLMEKPK